MTDDVVCYIVSPRDVSSSFYLGDNRGSGGEAISAFSDPIKDRNLCVGPLYIGAKGEYAGGVQTQVGDSIVKGEWVQIRSALPVSYHSVSLAFRPAQGASRFAILGSNDGSVFTEIFRADADAWPLERLVQFPFTNDAAYTHYRILLLQGQAGCNGYLCINRIQFE